MIFATSQMKSHMSQITPETVFAITDFERRVFTISSQITLQVMKKFNIWMPNIIFFSQLMGDLTRNCENLPLVSYLENGF